MALTTSIPLGTKNMVYFLHLLHKQSQKEKKKKKNHVAKQCNFP